MKKWNNPELVILGVENTNDENDIMTGALTEGDYYGMGEDHYCHVTGKMEVHVDNKHTGHSRNKKCPGVHWNAPQDAKCCCGGLS